MKELSVNLSFIKTIKQTESAIEKQANLELLLRYLSFRNVEYKPGLDVHEYLDAALIDIANDKNFDRIKEKRVFEETFELLDSSLGEDAFRRWDGTRFTGKFLMSSFEVLANGVSKNLEAISKLGNVESQNFIIQRAKILWDDPTFQKNSGAGVRLSLIHI